MKHFFYQTPKRWLASPWLLWGVVWMLGTSGITVVDADPLGGYVSFSGTSEYKTEGDLDALFLSGFSGFGTMYSNQNPAPWFRYRLSLRFNERQQAVHQGSDLPFMGNRYFQPGIDFTIGNPNVRVHGFVQHTETLTNSSGIPYRHLLQDWYQGDLSWYPHETLPIQFRYSRQTREEITTPSRIDDIEDKFSSRVEWSLEDTRLFYQYYHIDRDKQITRETSTEEQQIAGFDYHKGFLKDRLNLTLNYTWNRVEQDFRFPTSASAFFRRITGYRTQAQNLPLPFTQGTLTDNSALNDGDPATGFEIGGQFTNQERPNLGAVFDIPQDVFQIWLAVNENALNFQEASAFTFSAYRSDDGFDWTPVSGLTWDYKDFDHRFEFTLAALSVRYLKIVVLTNLDDPAKLVSATELVFLTTLTGNEPGTPGQRLDEQTTQTGHILVEVRPVQQVLLSFEGSGVLVDEESSTLRYTRTTRQASIRVTPHRVVSWDASFRREDLDEDDGLLEETRLDDVTTGLNFLPLSTLRFQVSGFGQRQEREGVESSRYRGYHTAASADLLEGLTLSLGFSQRRTEQLLEGLEFEDSRPQLDAVMIPIERLHITLSAYSQFVREIKGTAPAAEVDLGFSTYISYVFSKAFSVQGRIDGLTINNTSSTSEMMQLEYTPGRRVSFRASYLQRYNEVSPDNSSASFDTRFYFSKELSFSFGYSWNHVRDLQNHSVVLNANYRL